MARLNRKTSVKRQKHRSHRKGPVVEPWPRPKKGAPDEYLYVSVKVPNCVRMKWVVLAHVLLSDDVVKKGPRNHFNWSSNKGLMRWSKRHTASFSIRLLWL